MEETKNAAAEYAALLNTLDGSEEGRARARDGLRTLVEAETQLYAAVRPKTDRLPLAERFMLLDAQDSDYVLGFSDAESAMAFCKAMPLRTLYAACTAGELIEAFLQTAAKGIVIPLHASLAGDNPSVCIRRELAESVST